MAEMRATWTTMFSRPGPKDGPRRSLGPTLRNARGPEIPIASPDFPMFALQVKYLVKSGKLNPYLAIGVLGLMITATVFSGMACSSSSGEEATPTVPSAFTSGHDTPTSVLAAPTATMVPTMRTITPAPTETAAPTPDLKALRFGEEQTMEGIVSSIKISEKNPSTGRNRTEITIDGKPMSFDHAEATGDENEGSDGQTEYPSAGYSFIDIYNVDRHYSVEDSHYYEAAGKVLESLMGKRNVRMVYSHRKPMLGKEIDVLTKIVDSSTGEILWPPLMFRLLAIDKDGVAYLRGGAGVVYYTAILTNPEDLVGKDFGTGNRKQRVAVISGPEEFDRNHVPLDVASGAGISIYGFAQQGDWNPGKIDGEGKVVKKPSSSMKAAGWLEGKDTGRKMEYFPHEF